MARRGGKGSLAGPVLWVLVYTIFAVCLTSWLVGSIWPAVGPIGAIVLFSCVVGLLTRD